MVTLKDIAQEAGVSVMTVSNVVNGNLSKVSDKTAQQIQEIITRLNYIPNRSARNLVKNNSQLISIILRGEQGQNPLQNPHNALLIGTIIQLTQKHGYYAMINVMKDASDICQSIRSWNAEGAILIGMFDNEIEDICTVSDIPMVFIDSYTNIRQLSNVGIDDYKGGCLAAQCLIKHGHKSLAFIGPKASYSGVIQQRFSGFCNELEKCGLTFNPSYYFTLKSDVDFEEISALGAQLAKYRNKITGAFVTSDQIVSYLVNILKQNGMDIPRDLSIVGFDDLEICRQLTPQITTIAQDIPQKAKIAVEILFRRLKSSNTPAESIVLDVSLIERNSVYDIMQI